MKIKLILRNSAALCYFFLIPQTAKAQSEKDIFFQAGVKDAASYMQGYLSPIFNGLGYGFTAGWYNTANTHKPLGFDIQIMASVAFVPSSDLTFIFNNSEFERIKLSDPSNNRLPTFFGSAKKINRPELTIIDDQQNEYIRISSAPGIINKEQIGVNGIPIPMIQAGIGLIRSTDLKLRVVPNITFEKGSFRMSGFGIQHNISQWLPVLDKLGLDVSFLGAFHSAKLVIDLSEADDPNTKDNKGEFKINGMIMQGIASKTIKEYTLYAGVGYAKAASTTKIKGDYLIDDLISEYANNPINLSYSNDTPNFTSGVMVKIGFLTANTSFTFQKYPLFSLGFGVSIR